MKRKNGARPLTVEQFHQECRRAAKLPLGRSAPIPALGSRAGIPTDRPAPPPRALFDSLRGDAGGFPERGEDRTRDGSSRLPSSARLDPRILSF